MMHAYGKQGILLERLGWKNRASRTPWARDGKWSTTKNGVGYVRLPAKSDDILQKHVLALELLWSSYPLIDNGTLEGKYAASSNAKQRYKLVSLLEFLAFTYALWHLRRPPA
jgi:hypothetical protein